MMGPVAPSRAERKPKAGPHEGEVAEAHVDAAGLEPAPQRDREQQEDAQDAADQEPVRARVEGGADDAGGPRSRPEDGPHPPLALGAAEPPPGPLSREPPPREGPPPPPRPQP